MGVLSNTVLQIKKIGYAVSQLASQLGRMVLIVRCEVAKFQLANAFSFERKQRQSGCLAVRGDVLSICSIRAPPAQPAQPAPRHFLRGTRRRRFRLRPATSPQLSFFFSRSILSSPFQFLIDRLHFSRVMVLMYIRLEALFERQRLGMRVHQWLTDGVDEE